jgi:ATP adenylyltransferase
MFAPGSLWLRIVRQTEHAVRCGKQLPLLTAHEAVADGGVHFLLRTVAAQQRQAEPAGGYQTPTAADAPGCNPFLPFDRDLYVGDVSDTHIALLNKFNVIQHHILIVTRSWEEQTSPLSQADFLAIWSCLEQFESLAFYNAGQIAGASQCHKHLQLVPLPFTASDRAVPIEPLLEAVTEQAHRTTVPGLPFRHAFIRLDPAWVASPAEAATRTHAAYEKMVSALGLGGAGLRSRPEATAPYNLLLTREWMLVVPRSRECFGSISINALGFAGAFLVKTAEERLLLKEHGPWAALRHVAVPGAGSTPAVSDPRSATDPELQRD